MLYISQAKAANLAKLSVLIVDANKDVAIVIAEILASVGFGKTIVAVDTQEAFSLIANNPPDMVIAEWDMEPINGISLLSKIRNETDNKTIPIIILTEKANKKDVEIARDTGMNEFIVKPFTVATLCKRISLIVDDPRNFIIAPQYNGPDRRRQELNIDNEQRTDDADGLIISKNINSKTILKNGQDITIIDASNSIKEKLGFQISEIFTGENIKRAQTIIDYAKEQFSKEINVSISEIRNNVNINKQFSINEFFNNSNLEELRKLLLSVKSSSSMYGYKLATYVAEKILEIAKNANNRDITNINDKDTLQIIQKYTDIIQLIIDKELVGDGGKIGNDIKETLTKYLKNYLNN